MLTLTPSGVTIERVNRPNKDPFNYFVETHLLKDQASSVSIRDLKQRWVCDPNLDYCRDIPLKDLKAGLSATMNTPIKYNSSFQGWKLREPWFTDDESVRYDSFLNHCIKESNDGAVGGAPRFRADDLYPEAIMWDLDPRKLLYKLEEKFGKQVDSHWPGKVDFCLSPV